MCVCVCPTVPLPLGVSVFYKPSLFPVFFPFFFAHTISPLPFTVKFSDLHAHLKQNIVRAKKKTLSERPEEGFRYSNVLTFIRSSWPNRFVYNVLQKTLRQTLNIYMDPCQTDGNLKVIYKLITKYNIKTDFSPLGQKWKF